MTQGRPWIHIIKFSLPLLAGAVLQQLYSTVDTVVVGNFVGESALAAVGTTNTLVFFFLAIAIGFSAGNGVLIAQHFGAGRMDDVRRDASTGLLLLLLIGLLSGCAGILFSRWAYVKFVAVPPEILDSTLLYFRIYCAGLIFQFAYNSLAAILRSVGDSAATLYFLLLASVLNIALDLWFVAGLHWGVAGAAAATNVAQAFSVLAAWIYMQKKYPVFRCKLRDLVWDNAIAKSSFKLGWPIAMQLMIVAVGITFIQRAVNSFGQVMTATFTVGQRIEMYLHLPCNAMMTTLATYTGQNVGANKMERVRQGALQGVLISFFLTAVLALIVYFTAERLPGLFALGDRAAEYSQEYLKSIAFIVVILSLYVPLFGVFQGTRHVMVPTVIALCALTLRVIVTFVFKDNADCFGHTIIWWNGLFGFSTGCILSYIYYFSGRWKSNAQVK